MGEKRRRTVAAAALVLSMVSACGSSLSDEEILAVSGQPVDAGQAGATGPGSSSVSGATTATTVAGSSAVGSSSGPTADTSGGSGAAGPVEGANVSAGPNEAASGGGEASGSTACQDSNTGPVVLGNFGDYSGPAGASTVDIPNGVRIWAATLNARGGLCGRQIQFISADAGGDPARGAAIARQQVEQDGAVAFVSNSGLTSGIGAYPYLISNQIPVIGDPLADDSAKNSATIMAAYPTIQASGLAAMRAAFQISGLSRFGMMYCNESSICAEIGESFRTNAPAAGATWVWDANPSLVQVDFTAECRGAQQAGVEVMPLMMDAASLLRIVRSCNRQGFRPVYVLIGNAITATTITEPGFEEAIILSLSFPFAGASSPAIDEYQQARQTYFQDRPSNGGLATGWATAKLFEVVAIRAVQASGTMTSESIAAAMQTLQDERAGGLVTGATWGPQGSRSRPCVFPLRGDGAGGYIAPLGSDPVC